MANYRKSFNLRNGVQVDDDNFIVNANGLVGIGTSVPTEFLDVRGNAKVVGLVTASSIATPSLTVSGIVTATTITDGRVRINSGIITAFTGIITYYGDGSGLTNIPTSQWVTTSTPFGAASIYNTSGAIGILTNYPYHYVQIGGNPLTGSGVGFNSTGNIIASGIITASSGFSGPGSALTGLSASNITGTLANSILPSSISVSGIITASSGFSGNLSGNVIGIASTANSITSTANITVNSINSGFSTSGISTIHTRLNVIGNVGVGTSSPTAKVEILELTGSTGQLILKTPGNVGTANSTVFLRLNDTNGNAGHYGFSGIPNTLDIWNYKSGNIRFGINNQETITINSSGNLGIGSTNPLSKLSVIGDANINGSIIVSDNLRISGISTFNSNTIFNSRVGIATQNPLYDLQIGEIPITSSGVGISSIGNIIASGTVSAQKGFVSTNGGIYVTGIVTATSVTASGGFTSGNDNPIQIQFDSITNSITFVVPGVGSTSLTLYV